MTEVSQTKINIKQVTWVKAMHTGENLDHDSGNEGFQAY